MKAHSYVARFFDAAGYHKLTSSSWYLLAVLTWHYREPSGSCQIKPKRSVVAMEVPFRDKFVFHLTTAGHLLKQETFAKALESSARQSSPNHVDHRPNLIVV